MQNTEQSNYRHPEYFQVRADIIAACMTESRTKVVMSELHQDLLDYIAALETQLSLSDAAMNKMSSVASLFYEVMLNDPGVTLTCDSESKAKTVIDRAGMLKNVLPQY